MAKKNWIQDAIKRQTLEGYVRAQGNLRRSLDDLSESQLNAINESFAGGEVFCSTRFSRGNQVVGLPSVVHYKFR